MSKILNNSIIEIINKYNEFFLNKKNVNGIGLGFKNINTLDTKEPCLTIFVEKKITENKLYDHEIIPKNFLGIKTDIINCSCAKLCNYSSTIPTEDSIRDINILNSSIRPIEPGCNIGCLNHPSFGTLGAIVFDNDTNAPYILSNHHVLAPSAEINLGAKIIQPAIVSKDAFENRYKNIIAYLYKKVILKSENKMYPIE